MDSLAELHGSFNVQEFRKRLRSIEDEGAKLEECKVIRNTLLEQHTEMLYLFASIESVMLTECTRYKELKQRRTNNTNTDADWEQWARFVGIAEEGAKLKECTAPINKAIAYWGLEKVRHYEFLHVGWKFCKMLGTTVSRIHSWEEASIKINQITLARNCCRTSVNPISHCHLEILTKWIGCTDFVKEGRGGYTIKYEPISESDLSAEYVLDQYGLVILRQFARSPMEATSDNESSYDSESPTESTDFTLTPSPATGSPTPVRSPKMTEAPTPSESTASHQMPSLSPADTVGMTVRRSCTRKAFSSWPTSARPMTRPSHREAEILDRDANECTCSDDVPRDVLSSLESSQHTRIAGDIAMAMNEGAQHDSICLKHLRMYARWAASSIVGYQRLENSLPPRIPKRLASDSRDATWMFTTPPKRRRLSLPDKCSVVGDKQPSMASSDDEMTALRYELPAVINRPVSNAAPPEEREPSSAILNETIVRLPDFNTQSSFDCFRTQYLVNLREAINKSKVNVEHTIGKFIHCDGESRLRKELPRYQNILTTAILPHFLSYAEYSLLQEPPTNTILLATMEQAALVLQRGPLRIPILIPAQCRREVFCEESIQTFLNDFHMAQWIVVQDYAKSAVKGNDVRRVQKAEFMKNFFDPQHYPINCLDLAGATLNPDPPCYLQIPSLQLLSKVASGGHGGKMSQKRNTDLAASQSFTLLAKAGAWSMPHIDRSGVLSSVEGVDGDKLWLVWPGLSIAQLKAWDDSAADAPRAYEEIPPSRSEDDAFAEWQKSYAAAPCISPVATCIGPRDILLQPSGVLHSPYSITNVLMHGTMHWDSRDTDLIMELVLLETFHRAVTNEDQPNDFYQIMQRAIYKMSDDKQGGGGFKWPGDAAKEKTRSHFETWQSHHLAAQGSNPWKLQLQGCKCISGDCSTCVCVVNELRCSSRCHRGGKQEKCLNC